MIYPIQFCFPKSKLPLNYPVKETFFSDLTPIGQSKKYSFFEEEPYYNHYGKSYFAVTMKKGGWDCLRHYEILASGSIPYFIDIENCPESTLSFWDKQLLIEAKNLEGMPSEKEVIKAMSKGKINSLIKKDTFSEKEYYKLHSKIMNNLKSKLCSDYLSEYFLEKLSIKKDKFKILLCYGVFNEHLDYMRDMLILSLASNSRVELYVYPFPYWHIKGTHRQILNKLYGRGFTVTATLESENINSVNNWSELNLNIFDAIVACSTSNQGFEALPIEVKQSLEVRNDIIWIDGNDIDANHSIPKCAKLSFRREL